MTTLDVLYTTETVKREMQKKLGSPKIIYYDI